MKRAKFPFFKKNINPRPGVGIIEVILTLGLLALVVVVIGKVLLSTHRLSQASELKTQALAYSQESLEIVNDSKNDLFVCRCATETCGSNTCTRGSDDQFCNLAPAYTSCWTAWPADQIGNTDFYLQSVGGSWQLVALSPGSSETIAENQRFERVISIENVLRDVDGNIAAAGTADPETKKVTVTVSWQERGRQNQVSLSNILTAWENL